MYEFLHFKNSKMVSMELQQILAFSTETEELTTPFS